MDANILITGTSSGIGHALARAYLEEGARVFGMSRRSPDDLLAVPHYRHASIDLADFESTRTVLRTLVNDVEDLHLVILNAAVIGRIADIAETSVLEMKQTMEINVWSTKVVLDELYKLGRKVHQVVAISSGAAVSAQRGWNAYSISKAALNMLIGLYAAERPETHFSAIAPGIVDTRMQEYISSMPDDPRYASVAMLRKARGTPMMPQPDAVAEPLMLAFQKALKEPSGTFADFGTLLRKR
ncbi:MAG TPA: SDR family NAD(P)-dependent oxidoreductase [Methylomirabilota bacterium]|nr:SDR family NAD(P)-dependent oxidoreductase [Methylomirabilota bacterium]